MRPFMLGKIVVPIDFSEESFAALDVALNWASQPKEIIAIHVLADLPVNEPGVVWQSIKDETRVEQAKQAFHKRMKETGREGMEIEIALGNAPYQIAEFAKKIDAGMIIIPSHGRSGVKRMLIGSVAERVVRMAHCPVLVIRAGVEAELIPTVPSRVSLSGVIQ